MSEVFVKMLNRQLDECHDRIAKLKLNGKKPGRSWPENPLVTRIEFDRYKP